VFFYWEAKFQTWGEFLDAAAGDVKKLRGDRLCYYVVVLVIDAVRDGGNGCVWVVYNDRKFPAGGAALMATRAVALYNPYDHLDVSPSCFSSQCTAD